MDLDSAQIEIAVTASGPDPGAGAQDRAIGKGKGVARCLRCNALNTIALDKMAADANTCYRCRACGHIFSPSTSASVIQR